MQPIVVGMLVVLDHHVAAGEENEENIGGLKEDFILMKSNMGSLKKLREKSLQNNFKWTDVFN